MRTWRPHSPCKAQTEALADDAVQYAAQFGVTPEEALRRLKAQQASVAITDAIAREFADRLAGMSIEHRPEYRILVLLTGTEPVADRSAGGVPIVFRTGARATHVEAIQALRKHLIDLRSDLPNARGAGYDQRTGEVVLLVTRADADRYGMDAIRTRAEQVGGVPVRVGDQRAERVQHGGGRRRPRRGAQHADQPAKPLHDGVRRHQRRSHRDHDRRPLSG